MLRFIAFKYLCVPLESRCKFCLLVCLGLYVSLEKKNSRGDVTITGKGLQI